MKKSKFLRQKVLNDVSVDRFYLDEHYNVGVVLISIYAICVIFLNEASKVKYYLILLPSGLTLMFRKL